MAISFRYVVGAVMFSVCLVACDEVESNVAEGKACYRSVQCRAGLACIEGRCSSDLSSVGGTVPPLPTGGGPGSPPPSAGDGATSTDTGTPDPGETDAGAEVDAGVEMDAGQPIDAGESVDAGEDPSPDEDAGV